MQYFYVFRNTLISLCLVLGIAVLGLVAHWTDFTVTLDAGVLDFQIVGLITAVMTILSFPVLLLVPLIRKNAAISHVIVELPVLLVAWVLWMTTAILIIRWNSIIYPFGCDFTNVENVHWCTEFFAIERLSIAIWILLLVYWIALGIFALIHNTSTNPVWKRSVQDLPLLPAASAHSQQTMHTNEMYSRPELQQPTLPMNVVQTPHQYAVAVPPQTTPMLPQV